MTSSSRAVHIDEPKVHHVLMDMWEVVNLITVLNPVEHHQFWSMQNLVEHTVYSFFFLIFKSTPTCPCPLDLAVAVAMSSRAPHVQGANGAPCHDVNNVILCLLRWYCDHHLRWVWKDLVRKKCDLRWCCRIETRKATEWGVGWVKSDKRAVQQKQWSKKMGLSERIKDGKVRMLKWNLLDILLSDLAQMYSEFYSRLEHFTQVIYSGFFTWTFCPDVLSRCFASYHPHVVPTF